jgi:hypothetical protein
VVVLQAQDRIKQNCNQVPVFERTFNFGSGVNSTSNSVVLTQTGNYHVVSDANVGGIRQPIFSLVSDSIPNTSGIQLHFGTDAVVKHHIQLPNGDFIGVGNIGSINNPQILVLRTNATNSSIVWAKSFRVTTSANSGQHILLRSNGTLVVTGYALASPSAPLGIVLLNLDLNGLVLWHRYLQVNTGNFSYQTIEDDDKGLITNCFSGSGTYDGLVFKVDSNSNSVVWSRQFGSSSGDAAIASLKVGTNSFVTGGYIGGLSTAGNRDFCLIRFNPISGIQWAFTYGTSGEEFLTDLIRISDGNILAVGIGIDASTNTYSTILLKVDILGNIIWSTRANGLNRFNITNELGLIKELPNEGLVFVGNEAITSFVSKAALVKVTCQGTNNCSVVPTVLTRNTLPVNFLTPSITISQPGFIESNRSASITGQSNAMIDTVCPCPITPSFTTNTPSCSDDSLRVVNTSTGSAGVQFQWLLNGSVFSTAQTPSAISVGSLSTAQVQLMMTLPAVCTRQITQQITINNTLPPIPTEFTTCGTTTVTLQVASTPGVVYRWSPSDGLSDTTIANPTFTISSSLPSDYPIRKILRRTTTNGNCNRTDTLLIRLFTIPPGTGIALEQVSTLEQNESDVSLLWNRTGILPDSILIVRKTVATSTDFTFSPLNTATSISQFGLDTDSTSYRYTVRGYYACANESPPSTAETIWLRSNTPDNQAKLFWNPYKGWGNGVLRYEIWRGRVGSGALSRIASTTDTLFGVPLRHPKVHPWHTGYGL